MNPTQTLSRRIDAVDAIRGFAVMAIILLHAIEHFNFYRFPENPPEWLRFFDVAIWDSLFFCFGGKAYAIFALLFGFSFFVQERSQREKGAIFAPRFVWRLFLLFLFGNLNAMFFTGEVLVLYSLVGVVLLFANLLPNKPLMWVAAFCMLQPVEWYKFFHALLNPDLAAPASMASAYFANAYKVLPTGTFWETCQMNLWDGQLASLTWAWENGRFFQTASLFMIGLWMGREGFFYTTPANHTRWRNCFFIALLCFFPLNGLRTLLPDFITTQAALKPLVLIVKSLANFSLMMMLVTGLLMLFYLSNHAWKEKLMILAPYGKMSLTAYITQSIIGGALFYGWGFALYKHLGVTYSFLVGVIIFLLQLGFATWWMKRKRQGPLEYVWHRLTWIGRAK